MAHGIQILKYMQNEQSNFENILFSNIKNIKTRLKINRS